MPGKTNTEKIDELARRVEVIDERLGASRTELAEVRPLASRVAVLEHQVSDLKERFVWLRNLGAAVVLALAGLVGTLLTLLLHK